MPQPFKLHPTPTNRGVPVEASRRRVKHLPSNCPSKPGRRFYETQNTHHEVSDDTTTSERVSPEGNPLYGGKIPNCGYWKDKKKKTPCEPPTASSFLFLSTFSFSGLRNPFGPGVMRLWLVLVGAVDWWGQADLKRESGQTLITGWKATTK